MHILQGHTGAVRCLAYSPDGTTLASVGNDSDLLLWDPISGQVRCQCECEYEPAPSTCVAFSPNKRYLATGSANGAVFRWDCSMGRCLDRYGSHTHPVNVLSFVAGGEFLVTGAGDRKVKRADGQAGFRDIVSGEGLLVHLVGGPVWSLASDVDGHLIIFGLNDKILVTQGFRGGRLAAWVERARSEQPARTMGSFSYVNFRYYEDMLLREIPRSRSRSMALSPDLRTLAVAVGRDVELWEPLEGPLQTALSGHDDEVLSLAFSPNGQTLASASRDGTICFWDVNGRCRSASFDWEIGRIHCVAFAPDGMTIAAGGDSGLVIWDIDELC